MAIRFAGALASVALGAWLTWGAPAVAAAPPPLEIYGQLPKTEAAELSPDGTMVAMVATLGDTRMLAVQKVGGAVVAHAPLGDYKLSDLAWAGNDYLLVYLRQSSGLVFGHDHEHEYVQAVVADVKAGTVKPLLQQSVDHMTAIFGRYGFAERDGHWYAYIGVVPTTRTTDPNMTTGLFKQRYPDLYRVDLESGSLSLAAHGSTNLRSWVVDAHGDIAAESEYVPETGNWKVFLPGSPSAPIASGHSTYGFRLVGLGTSSNSVVIETDDDSDEVTQLHLDSGHIESLVPPGKSVLLIHSPLSRLLLGAVLIDDNQTLMFDQTLDRHYRSIEKAFQGDNLRLVSASGDMGRIIVHVQGKDNPGTWQFIDFGTGKADPIADDYPGIPDNMLGEAKLFKYNAADGLATEAVLTMPPGAARNLPLVVIPHGGPEARDRVDFDWMAQAFASRGYAVFQPNFRGSTGYGTKFRDAGFGQWGRKMQTDVSDGVAALAAQGIVDPKRACILGASLYGGYVAMAGITIQHNLYRCAASYGGVSDPRDWFNYIGENDTGDARRYSAAGERYWRAYLGIEKHNDDVLDTISPQAHAKEVDAPVLLIHGKKDSVVPIKQSEDMESALKRAGKQVEFVKLDGEDHWLSRSATRLQMLKAMVAFVEKYNPPDAGATH